MQKTITALTGEVRKALDDITPNVVDDFSTDSDAEIAQALVHAAMSLSMSLPMDMVEPKIDNLSIQDDSSEECCGFAVIPEGFLKFVSLKVNGWKGVVSDLIEKGSEAEKRQRSKWSRGTASKPKAMIDGRMVSDVSKLVIRFWPTGTGTATLIYIPKPIVADNTLTCALRDVAEKNLIYLACRIFLEGKKESNAAEAFAKLTDL